MLGSVTSNPSAPVLLHPGLSREFLLHHGICPSHFDADGALVVLVAPDAFVGALDDLHEAYGCEVRPTPAALDVVVHSVERLATAHERAIELTRFESGDDDFAADARDLANQPPVVRFVNMLVREAFDAGASDIHLDAARNGLAVRIRIDGVLTPAVEPPSDLHLAVVSRVKMLADLDISERRLPQDGRIRVRLDAGELDLRVSTVPTLHGESVVMRILDRGGRPVSLDELGMPDDLRSRIERACHKSSGLFLATGPTGSGKTTTLYAALQHRDQAAEKIVTVEDPIEYHLPGITQVPVHTHGGVTFASALRALLRQDPDVLLIGEMRDAETAEIAVRASMTGHFVFSTLHTTDALGAIVRLLDLGLPPYLLAATLEVVLAQRLVRRTCDRCRASYTPDPAVCASISEQPVGSLTLTRGAGCPSCRGTGYRGRIGLFEYLPMTDDLRDAISRGAHRSALRPLAEAAGMRSLRSDAWARVVAGHTTVEEIQRVLL